MPKRYIPERRDIVWLDFEPTQGKEIGKYRPALVLSSTEYNKINGLLICCPISTSIRGVLTEVPVRINHTDSVIATTLIQTLSWTSRRVRYQSRVDQQTFDQVLHRVIPLIGGENYFQR
ncbi:MAG: type II toxin-antitoxin system PemK/MazF family toxin [Pseudomonadota bacterium]